MFGLMRFESDPAFEAEIRKSPELDKELHSQASEVRSRAVAIAPHGPTGMYRRSLTIKSTSGTGAQFVGRLADIAGSNTNPAKYAVATTDFAGHLVEWGSANNKPYAVLRRATRTAGLRLVEDPKPS